MRTVLASPLKLFLVAVTLIFLPAPAALADCPANLADRADVALNPPGLDFDAYFTDDVQTSVDYFPRTSAEWVRDALSSSHDIYIGAPHNFRPPYFNDSPNDTCVFDSANTASAPHGRITVDAPRLRAATEPFLRAAVAHELFHHVQYSYINFNDWPSWGKWAVEGTARLMEDKITLDNDVTRGNTWYVGEVNGFLADPNRTLTQLSYPAALFWNYLTEQLGTPFAEPARGVDVVERFWRLTSGHDPDGMRYLRDTIRAFDPDRSLEDLFLDFAVTNYTHRLDVSALPEPDRYRYFDESAAGGGTAYDPVARQAVTTWEVPHADSVQRWAARYLEAEVHTEKACEVIGVRAKARDDKALSWALIGVQDLGKVAEVSTGAGNSFSWAAFNPATAPFDRLALAAVGRGEGAVFEYAFGSGPTTGEIRLPTERDKAFVGTKAEPDRFQVRLLVQGPAVLTPPGAGAVSLKGLDSSKMEVTLRSPGTGAAYPAEVLNGSYVSGEYWLAVKAPVITDPDEGDTFDLEVCACTLAGGCANPLVSAKSVYYGTCTRNQLLVLDRSRSMHHPTDDPKIDAAKNAARLYTIAAAENDRVGLVTFNGNDSECDHDAVLDFEMRNLFGIRPYLEDAIDAVEVAGHTSIGDGIKEARDELLRASTPADRHAMVLLSDGLQNEGDYWGKGNSACGTPPVRDSFDPATGAAAGVQIDTVGFGADADQGLLQTVAEATGGRYYYVTTASPSAVPPDAAAAAPAAGAPPAEAELFVPNRLAQVYRTIEEEIHGQDRLFYSALGVAAGGSRALDIPVTEREGGGVRDAVFAFNWNVGKAAVTIGLRDPSGRPIDAASPGWLLFEGATAVVYHFTGVLPPGDWGVTVRSDTDVQVIAMLSGRVVHGVDVDLRLSQVKAPPPSGKCEQEDRYTYLRGLPVTILLAVADDKGGIDGLAVVATVTNPAGSTNRLTLYDDGGHDDGAAGDGVYGNLYTRTCFASNSGVPDFPEGPPTGDDGSYGVAVSVEGESNFGEKIRRYAGRSFQVFEFDPAVDGVACKPDTDGDGLPDRWEDLRGLNKASASDAGLDPDGDGLKNVTEFLQGTLPRGGDTDLGGEADGSEVKGGRDPLYDKDDLLPPIADYGIVDDLTDIPVHEPRPNTNILHFPVSRGYATMEIWRTTPGSLGFRQIARVNLAADRRGVWYDRGLVNGAAYSYYLVARGAGGEGTARTEIFTGRPKADPVPPKGWIKINRGATRSDSLTVRLLLDTSGDAKSVRISQRADFAGALWQPLLREMSFTLADAGPDPFPATVYAVFRDAALNVSTLYSDTIVVDRAGDFDSDGTANALDADDDGDGLSDAVEVSGTAFFTSGYDPFNADSDGDGVQDGREDHDRDRQSNVFEIGRGLDPGRNLADVNRDNKFTAADVALFNVLYRARDRRADVNGDRKVNLVDQSAFQKAYDNELKYLRPSVGR